MSMQATRAVVSHTATVFGLVTVRTEYGDTVDEIDFTVGGITIEFNDYRNEQVIASALREIADDIEQGTMLAGRETRRTRKNDSQISPPT